MNWLEILSGIGIPVALAFGTYLYNAFSALSKDVDSVRASLDAWKLQIATNYVTKVDQDKMEVRIITALDRLDVKLDRALGRSGHAD